ncbi:TIGR01212 family radical SAM protein [Kiritimatiella glycovorans]|uniref:Bifunctional tRNA (Mnm(5)s(2)U34)-methyltransferase/FAD-dependent cmnm(5)s(2)U34 oxidoreductase n=1 Tax=Kiritimatiella glycovorans TaxID=1307763 RepID=A0A0G3ECZ6_9BACT|nr:TIGR01212 family radical SAM protein [Kiritimatiella glycovorans]AKJ64326.1 bifunctional tRNA (mnm(5)s(2)U34)-methyltransferase/FAD-dependent cmnm(5)s(2)U34 oxidoreductase [Kiritimatiella glycovorans]
MSKPPTSDPPPFRTYRDFMIERYGGTLQRIPVDFGTGCPHRAEDGSGGCTFCAEHGGRARQTLHAAGIEEQVRRGVQFARGRYGGTRFWLYAQTWTPTLAPPEVQRRLFERALGVCDADVVSVGARPDCLPPPVLDVLEDLAQGRIGPAHPREVWVEPGIQSLHDATLRRIRRGHDAQCGLEAIRALKRRGFRVAPHLILGLPGESFEGMMETVERLAAEPVDAVKLHNLHVIRGTALAEEYRRRPFPVPGPLEYAELLLEALRRLPPDLPVMRLCTDTPGEERVAPVWRMNKGAFTEHLVRLMRGREARQGDRIGPVATSSGTEAGKGDEAGTTGDDGSVTRWNAQFSEHYHCRAGAWWEARTRFVEPASPEGFDGSEVRVLDVCFGLGYNTLAALIEARRRGRARRFRVDALEIDRGAVRWAAEHIRPPEDASLCPDPAAILRALYTSGHWRDGQGAPEADIAMHWGGAREKAPQLDAGAFDLIFHDPFSTQRNSELWTVDFFRILRRLIRPGGLLLTYSRSRPVCAGLRQAGFAVGDLESRHAVLASPDPARVGEPRFMDPAETGSIPFRDPWLCRTNREVLRARERRIRLWKK